MATTSIAIPHEGQKEIAAQGWVVLLVRVLFALIFIISGPNHFAKQTIAYAAAQGVPLASLAVPFSGLMAIAGGLSILLGYRTRIGAWLIVLFLVPVSFMMHNFWAVADPMMKQMQMMMIWVYSLSSLLIWMILIFVWYPLRMTTMMILMMQ